MPRFIVCLLVLFLSAAPCAASETIKPSGRWTTTVQDGVHWLVTPEGERFYSKGVNIIEPGVESPRSKRFLAYWWNNFYPSLTDWRCGVGERLRAWGFNTRGGWSDASTDLALPLTVDLELGRSASFHWFDPFDPAMESTTTQWAEKLTAPFRDHPQILGYYTDNEVGWWNSALFLYYLNEGWGNHTKRVLWQLLHEHYRGDWDRLLADWAPQGKLSSFEDLKQSGALLKLRPGGQGIHLVNRFMHVYVKRYYQLMSQAIRQAHPGALVLGDRLPLYYHQDAVLAIGNSLDVISTNYNVDVPDGWIAPYYFDGLRRLTGKPVLITEFFFAAEENRSGNRNETARSKHPKPGHLMTVQTQAERARGVANALRHFARFPNVVGAHWFQYCDEPWGGRHDGEDYNMGLIDNANRPYEEVTEVFRTLNPQLESVHSTSAAGLRSWAARMAGADSRTPHKNPAPTIPRAATPLDLTDQSLLDWDKEGTRLPDLHASGHYVPFGDIHLTWTPQGLSLATIANTYFDPRFLAYEGAFPLSETFQIHLMVEAEGKLNHLVAHLVPQPNPSLPDGFELRPKLFRYVEGRPAEPLPIEGHIQHIEKSLPHMSVEAFIPAEWLGLKAFQASTRLRMNILVVSTYREMSMAWSGKASLRGLDNAKALRTVILEDFPEEKRAEAVKPRT